MNLTRNNFTAPIGLFLVGIGCVLSLGCQSAGFPKLPTLAFWKKDGPVLTARHDNYIEPPASNVAPIRSSFANSQQAKGLPSTHPPKATNSGSEEPVERYAVVDDEPAQTLAEAAAKLTQRDQELTRFNPQPTNSATSGSELQAEANRLIRNKESDAINASIGQTPVLDQLTRGGGFNSNDVASVKTTPVDTADGISPKRISNPYTAGSENQFASNNANRDSGFGSDTRTSNATASYNYPTTPYREFQTRENPDASNRSTTNEFNALAPVLQHDAQNQPLMPTPLTQASMNQSTNTNPAAGRSPEPIARTASLPESLINSQGWFAPGSIRQFQREADGGTSPMLKLPQQPTSTESSASTASSHSSSNERPLNLQNGGSFNFK